MHLNLFTLAALLLAANVVAAQPSGPAVASCSERAPLSVSRVDGVSLRATGASVGVIDSASLAPFMKRTLSEALTARIPGVSVLHSSGVAGTGARVRLRGPGGILLNEEPLLFIDGLRVEGRLQSVGLDAGGQAPSRLDDVSVDDVECIYVLRGPAATARYGTDAAGGIIHVMTRRAGRDSTRVRAFLEGGSTTDVGDYPANYGMSNGCSRARAALGQCVAGTIQSWSPLDEDSPFRSAALVHGGGSATLISRPRVSFGVSGNGTLDDGALRNNEHQRYSAAATGAVRPGGTLSVEGDLWFMGGKTRLPQVGNLMISILNSALLGSSVDDPVRRGYRLAPLSVLERFGTDQRLYRLGGVARARWTPNAWLSVGTLAGREDVRVRDEQSDPSFQVSTLPSIGPPSYLASAEQRAQRTSANVSATATYQRARARLTTEVGLDYLEETDRRVRQELIINGSLTGTRYSYAADDPVTTGLVVRQTVAAGDRVFLEGGVRHDFFGRTIVDLDDPTYPFLSAAWDVVRRTTTPESRTGLSTLRFRAAYGESGDRRPYGAAIELAVTVPSVPVPSVPVPSGTASSPSVERTREIEGGADLGLFGDRATIGVTYFSRRTSDALVPGLLPPSVGGSFPIVTNAGSWQNRGVEIGARARLIDAASVRADVAVSFTSLRNKVLSLGNNAPTVGTSYRIAPGYPLYGAWGRPFAVVDQDNDGAIVPSEVVAEPESRFLGSSVPTRELGVAPSIVFGGAITIAALIDYRGGFRVNNSTGRIRCIAVCGELYMPDVSASAQARAVDQADAAAGWIEDASFVKLRELALSWTMPASFSRVVGARSAALGLAGRNLLTSTDYTGLDPEVASTGQTRIDQQELFTLPLPRTVSLRLDLRW